MSIPDRDLKILWGRASATCSFPKCGRRLIGDRTTTEREVVFGEGAHIIPEKDGGPRGPSTFTLAERNCYENLILLCEEHHTLVDAQWKTYSIEILHGFKREHEAECERRQLREAETTDPFERGGPVVTDRLHATVLAVSTIPQKLRAAPLTIPEEELIPSYQETHEGRRPPAHIVRGKRVWSFDNLATSSSPFAPWIDAAAVETVTAPAMWLNPDHGHYYVTLLNRVLAKLLGGTLRLKLDPDYGRWFFPAPEDGSDRSETWVPPKKSKSDRYVAWRPTKKATGEKRPYWEHLALSTRFIRIDATNWILALRPERHFTRDGAMPLLSKGRRASSRAAKLRNWELVEDAHFWRGFLAQGAPRIIRKLGDQALVIEAELLQTSIEWPGVPADHKDFANTSPEETIFSWIELAEALDQPVDDEHLPELE